MSKRLFMSLAMPALAGLSVLSACGDNSPPEVPVVELNLVETAATRPELSTWTTAVEAAGLELTLSQGGPYTLFVPSNAAFELLPAGTVEAWLSDPDPNKAALLDVLSYHIVSGEVLAGGLVGGTVQTLANASIFITVDAGGIRVNDAAVIEPDVRAKNGVIHVLDRVLITSG